MDVDASWTAPEVERVDPDRASDERTSLEQWLDFHRATLLGKCAGLTGEQLATRAVPPSSLSLLGLVRHMVEVERWWFRINVGGEDLAEAYCRPDSPDADFDEVDPACAQADLAALVAEIALARAAAAGRRLDDRFEGKGSHRHAFDVRWVYVHMVEEYARHNGHADLLRELVDGATGD